MGFKFYFHDIVILVSGIDVLFQINFIKIVIFNRLGRVVS